MKATYGERSNGVERERKLAVEPTYGEGPNEELQRAPAQTAGRGERPPRVPTASPERPTPVAGQQAPGKVT